MTADQPPRLADYPNDPDGYLHAMRLYWRGRARLRPTRDQAGHADLPLFQTDIEEFTGPDAIRP